MKKKLLLLIAIVVFLSGVVIPSYAQGKSDQAPRKYREEFTPQGLVKKLEEDPQRSKKLGVEKMKEALESTKSGVGQLKKLSKVSVVQATSAAQLKRRAVMGVISDIIGNIINLVHQIQRDRTYRVLVNEQTVYHIKGIATGSGSLADLSIGQRIAAVGDLAEDGGILAKRIHVIPGKATGIFQRFPIATPSATPTSTPSATLTPTPTL